MVIVSSANLVFYGLTEADEGEEGRVHGGQREGTGRRKGETA
jgi:hypothetical protein